MIRMGPRCPARSYELLTLDRGIRKPGTHPKGGLPFQEHPGQLVPMASLRTLFISLLAALTLAAAPTASAIVDGSVDVEHDYVVFVGQQVQSPGRARGSTPWACSGVLVAPTVVVTAAHCTLLGPSVPPSWIRWVVIQGESTRSPEAMQVVGHVRRCIPGFCIGCPGAPEGFANNDLAVVLLDSPLPGPYAKLPKPASSASTSTRRSSSSRPGTASRPGPARTSAPAGRRRPVRSSPRTPRTSCYLPVPEQEEVRHGLRG